MQYQYYYHHQTSVLIMDEKGWQTSSSAEMIMSPNCPRCGSSNTKFCYYNNYSLTQPRYFCKGCRRYWTKGGNLRNVPVGGGCRKNRRPTTTKSSSLRFHSSTTHNNRAAAAPPHPLSDSATPSHIDLALVYANFLNNPESTPQAHQKVISDDVTIIVGGGVLEDDSSSPNNIQMLDQPGINNSFGWDSLSDLFSDTTHHLKVTRQSISPQIYDIHHPHSTIQQSSRAVDYFELPPLPGEEGVIGCQEITMEAAVETWSDSGHQLLLDHDVPHSLEATELLPIIISGPPHNNEAPAPATHHATDQDSHDLNLIGTNNNSKDFDFEDHNTFLTN